MKILCVYPTSDFSMTSCKEQIHPEQQDTLLYIKPDTSLLSKGQSFYYPEYSKDIQVRICLVAKICKIGKFVAPSFAPKYYEKLSIGIDFWAKDVQQDLSKKGLPWQPAIGFDASMQVLSWKNKEDFFTFFKTHTSTDTSQECVTYQINENQIPLKDIAFAREKLHEGISKASKQCSLKIGDLVSIDFSLNNHSQSCQIQDQLQVQLDSNNSLYLKIK